MPWERPRLSSSTGTSQRKTRDASRISSKPTSNSSFLGNATKECSWHLLQATNVHCALNKQNGDCSRTPAMATLAMRASRHNAQKVSFLQGLRTVELLPTVRPLPRRPLTVPCLMAPADCPGHCAEQLRGGQQQPAQQWDVIEDRTPRAERKGGTAPSLAGRNSGWTPQGLSTIPWAQTTASSTRWSWEFCRAW